MAGTSEYSETEVGGVDCVDPVGDSSESGVGVDAGADVDVELRVRSATLLLSEVRLDAAVLASVEFAILCIAVGGAVPRGGGSCTMDKWVNEGVAGHLR